MSKKIPVRFVSGDEPERDEGAEYRSFETRPSRRPTSYLAKPNVPIIRPLKDSSTELRKLARALVEHSIFQNQQRDAFVLIRKAITGCGCETDFDLVKHRILARWGHDWLEHFEHYPAAYPIREV